MNQYRMLAGICMLALVMVSSGCGRPEAPAASSTETASSDEEKVIALANAEAVSDALFERIRAFVQAQLGVVVQRTLVQKAEGDDLDGIVESISDERKPSHSCLVVLVSNGPTDKHASVDNNTQVAVVNITPLQTDDSEKFARRLERQVMRSIAFLFGLPPTPDPHGVTYNYSSVDDLDKMGRNFCPPWQKRFRELAKERNLVFVKNSTMPGNAK